MQTSGLAWVSIRSENVDRLVRRFHSVWVGSLQVQQGRADLSKAEAAIVVAVPSVKGRIIRLGAAGDGEDLHGEAELHARRNSRPRWAHVRAGRGTADGA